MKKFMSVVLSAAMVASMGTNAFAAGIVDVDAKADGSNAYPFVEIPNSSIDEATGILKPSYKVVNTEKEQKLFVGISSTEVDVTEAGKHFFVNELNMPAKGNVVARIHADVADEIASDMSEGKIGEGIEITINNEILKSELYTFKTGVEYEIKVSYNNGLTEDEKDTGSLRWIFTIPEIDTEAPVMKLTSTNASISEENGIVKIVADNANRIDVDFTFMDENAGLSSVQIVEYSDAEMTKPVVAQPAFDGEVVPAALLAQTYPNSAVYHAGTGALSECKMPMTFSGANSYLTATVVDNKGQVSTHIIHIEGITNQNDETAPVAYVEGVKEVYDENGNVASVKGFIKVEDALSNLSKVVITNGGETVAEAEKVNGKVFSYEFEVAEGEAYGFEVIAMDKGGNTVKETLSVAEYFANNQKPEEKPGEGETQKPEEKPADVTKPTVALSHANGVVTVKVADETSVKSLIVSVGNEVILSKEYVEGTKAETATLNLNDNLYGKAIMFKVVDHAGNEISRAETFAKPVAPKPEVKGEAITSAKKLSKLIEKPTVVYDDEETTYKFTLDTSKYTYAEGDLKYEIRKGNKRVKNGSGEVEKGVIEFTFEDGKHDEGTYKLVLEYENPETEKEYEATYEFDVEYREDSPIANALKVSQEIVKDGKVVITLTLDEDKLEEEDLDADDAEWTLPNKEEDNGDEIEYTVDKAGSYKFKIEIDDEEFTYTVKVESVTEESEEDAPAKEETKEENNTQYNGADAPVPGKGLISSITTTNLVIELPMTNWDTKEWSIQQSSVPSNVTYTVKDSTIIFTVPNSTFQMSFKLVNSKGEYVAYNFGVQQMKADGSNMQSNAQTGGIVSNAASNGVVMALNGEAARKEDEVDDTDIQ